MWLRGVESGSGRRSTNDTKNHKAGKVPVFGICSMVNEHIWLTLIAIIDNLLIIT